MPGSALRGTLADGLFWPLLTGFAALGAIVFFYPLTIGLMHLSFVGTFGPLIPIVGSWMLFGNGRELKEFGIKSRVGCTFITLAVIAASRCAIPAFVPKITVSYHIYAAAAWALRLLLKNKKLPAREVYEHAWKDESGEADPFRPSLPEDEVADQSPADCAWQIHEGEHGKLFYL